MKRWLGALACPLALAACGGGGGGSTLPTPTATSVPVAQPLPASTLPPEVVTNAGAVNGATGVFTPTTGDTPSGGSGAPVDGITCDTVMHNAYHVHAYLGMIVNGSWLAPPTAVGMIDPQAPVNGFVDAASCFYWIHTHDSSGYVHLESPNAAPIESSQFTLGEVMSVWGQTLSATQFGPFSGVVRVFTAQAPSGSLVAKNYTEYTGDFDALPLYSHEAVWIEVNPPYTAASQLPPVQFYTEY